MWLRYTVAFLAGSKVKASFSQSVYGQDNLCESLIRGVTDPPTKVAKIGHGQQSRPIGWSKIVDHSGGWNYIVHSDHPLFHL